MSDRLEEIRKRGQVGPLAMVGEFASDAERIGWCIQEIDSLRAQVSKAEAVAEATIRRIKASGDDGFGWDARDHLLAHDDQISALDAYDQLWRTR